MDLIDKLKSSLTNLTSPSTNSNTNSTNHDENVIDIQKTFSSDNVDVTPIIKTVLHLEPNFPNNILLTPAGHKYHELEFFQTNLDSSVDTTHKSFFDNFNKCQTQLGTSLLQSIILQPTTNINLLTNRQQLVKSFFNLPNNTQQQIFKLLEECKKLEKDLLAMQIDDTPEMLEVYKVIFFEFLPLRHLNYNELFMKFFYYFIIIFSPIYGIFAPFGLLITPFLFMRYGLKIPITFSIFWSIAKNMILGGTGFFSNLNKLLNSGAGKVVEGMIGGGEGLTVKGVIINLVKWIVAFMNSGAGTVLYIGFLVFSYLYSIYNTVQVSITYNKVINMFHSRLNIISKWLCNVREFINLGLGCQSVEISNLVTKIKNIFDSDSTIKTLLDHSTFKYEPSIFSNKGIIIKTFKQFLDNKKVLEPFCEYIAHIDAWRGVGQWLHQGLANSHTMCKYITPTSETVPQVRGIGLTNICCSHPVANDVVLGGGASDGNDIKENFNNLLITGPNGSGKSTYIKGIIECILLGQTVGVVPAKEFTITPFTHIATYLNIPDCQGKESLFQAEMNRCYQQLQMLKDAEAKGEFSFSIMDEIFVSTNYQEGMSGAYAIIKRMCNMSRCINVITTHFDVLANMDEMKVCKKYFDIEMDNELIKKDYIIKDGVSSKHMALKLLAKKGFDKDIITDAEYLYNKLQGILEKPKTDVEDANVEDVVVEDEVEDAVDEQVTDEQDGNNVLELKE